MRKRLILALVIGGVVFATVVGMAASLGTVTAKDLGAGNSTVASCDTDGVSVSYSTSYDGASGRYEVASVTVDGIADTCDGQTLTVVLADSAGAQLAEGSVTVPVDGAATTASVTLANPPAASAVENVHIVIAN